MVFEIGDDYNVKKMKFIDLFAGIGGFRLVLEKYGAKCVFSSEFNKHAAKTYYDNFGEYPSGDITEINENEVPEHDILCAGFPCQPFSISGNQLGFEDTRGTLFFDIIRIVRAKKPSIIFLENVANLAKHNDSKTVETMTSLLKAEGYKVFIETLNSVNFGVPQERKRLYFVAFRNDLEINDFTFPVGNISDRYVRDIIEFDNKDQSLIVNKDYVFTREDESVPQNKIVRLGYVNKGGQGDRIYSVNGYGITLSASGGGSASKTGGYLINGVFRKLTTREAARMQGFPEDFIINPLPNQAYTQFGNSVAIPVIDAIVKEINNTLKIKTT